jgi:hypothetical protein
MRKIWYFLFYQCFFYRNFLLALANKLLRLERQKILPVTWQHRLGANAPVVDILGSLIQRCKGAFAYQSASCLFYVLAGPAAQASDYVRT